jgi:hypothetical protein
LRLTIAQLDRLLEKEIHLQRKYDKVAAGVDGKVTVTNDLISHISPDFGQVERILRR